MVIDIASDTRILIYNASLLSGFILLYLRAYSVGLRAGFTKGPWLASLAILFIALVTGMRWGGIPMSDWEHLMQGDLTNIHPRGFSLMGGILFFIPFFLVLQRQFHWPLTALDRIAIFIPIVIAIGRIGCLFAGCCSGSACALPWGINYGTGTPTLTGQINSGIVDATSTLSNPVHPFSAYVIFLNGWIVILLYRFRKKLPHPGQLTLLTIALLFLSRFILEFFRSPDTNHGFAMPILGLKVSQWILLLAGLVALWKTIHLKPKTDREECTDTLSAYPSVWISFLSLGLLLITWTKYSSLEIVLLFTIILPLFLHLALSAFAGKYTFPDHLLRWAHLPSLAALIIIMPTDSIPLHRSTPDGASWVQLGFSIAQSPFEQSKTERFTQPDCAGDSIVTHTSKIKVVNYSGDLGVHMLRDDVEFVFGCNAMYTEMTRSASSTGFIPEGTYYFRSIGPYIQVDGRVVGASIGWQFIDSNYPGDPQSDLILYPSERQHLLLRFRLGLRHRFFVEYNKFQWSNYPTLPGQAHSIYAAHGLNRLDGSAYIRLGIHIPNVLYDNVRVSAGGRIPVFNNTALIEPEIFTNKHGFQYALGVRLNIGKQ
ncbi:MAG: prolipoprotein diacylglyceryl transferase [Saprospiraceae bacterium]|nr:prolipoprotein diacylglyceryl transferase [Saprospiraceae bacterium]